MSQARYPLQDITRQFQMERPGETTFCLRRKSPEELYQEDLEHRIHVFRSRKDLIKVQLGKRPVVTKTCPTTFDEVFQLESLDDPDLISKELDEYFTNYYSPVR